MKTPWGKSDRVEWNKQGDVAIAYVTTPSHGGWYIPLEHLHRLSEKAKAYALTWSGSEQWYEEDCAWAYVAEAFPEMFTPEERFNAEKTLNWIEREESNA